MKRFYVSAIFLFVVVLFSSQPAHAQQQTNYPRLISVTAEAQVKVVPDEVVLRLGVETWDRVLTVAQSQNDVIVQKTFDIAKEFKLADKDIQTDYIKIVPTYDNNNYNQYDKGHITGYLAQKTIAINLKDVNKFETLLTQLLQGGVNHVHGIQFNTSELKKYRDQARSLAIKAAREKAENLAKELGVKVGKPYNVSTYSGGWWMDYGTGWGGGYGGAMYQNVQQSVNTSGNGEDSEGNSLALGQIKVNASVSVSFEIE